MVLMALSRPTRGVWIETRYEENRVVVEASRPTRGVWIETLAPVQPSGWPRSRPTRGVWIETPAVDLIGHCDGVAPHAGRVD